MFNNLFDFSFDEISEWINDYLSFFTKPRKIISKIIQKEKTQIIKQFLFHFLIYASSFVFLSLGNINEWIKPAIINIFIAIPVIILYITGTKISSNKNYLKEIIVYIFGCLFCYLPLLIIVYSTFLATENYTYRYILEILSALIILYVNFNFGFAIEENKTKALKITIINYLLLNLLFFTFQRINNDPYSTSSFNSHDPIYEEYKNLVEPIKNKEIIPTKRIVTVFNNNVSTNFTLQNIIKDTVSKSNDQEELIYLKTINSNINNIKEYDNHIAFKRNKNISKIWLQYYNEIKNEAELKITDTIEIRNLQLQELSLKNFNKLGGRMYMMNIDISKIFKYQVLLKEYNNSIIQNHLNSNSATDSCEVILFFFGKLADYIVGDLILKEGEPKVYKETFEEIE